VKLLDQGEESLIEAVEARRIPITIAVTIANGTNEEVQRALSRAYEKGDLRGARLTATRRIIAKRLAKGKKGPNRKRRLSARDLVREYNRHAEKSRKLVKRAAIANQRLILLVSVMRKLYADENFVTLLRAEALMSMPEYLDAEIKLEKSVAL